VDATAARVAKMAREIPEHGSDSQGSVGDATLEEFISVLSKQLRTGLVSSLSAAGSDPGDLKLTLGRGRPLTEFLDTFVRRVRRHVVRAEPLRYELGAQPADTVGAHANRPASTPEIAGLRVVLADDDTPRSDAIAQELRQRGVTVVVTDLEPSPTRFQTLRQADPTVFVIGEDHAHGAGYDLLRRLRRDSRLRWASLLVVRWDEIWAEERGAPTLARLASTLAGLVEPERALFARAEARVAFDTRLETTGPARCLRVLEKSPRPLRLRIENPRVELTLDLSDGLVVGAEGRTLELETRPLSGVSALSALLVLGSGRVRVEPVDQPASANIMTPVEAALTMADAETPPISPSIPASGTVSLHPPGPSEPLSAPVGSIRPAPIVSVAGAVRAPPRPAMPPAPPSSAQRPPRTPEPVMATAPSLTTTATHEHNPPAMTLSAPASGPSPLPPSTPDTQRTGWRARAQTLSAWFAAQDAKLHGRRISFGTAAVLVGLGAFQGLLIVTLYAGARWLSRPHVPLERVAAARDLAPERAVPSAAPVPPATPAPSAAVAGAPTVAPVASGQGDGSGSDVPDCATLLKADPPHAGFYPGSALKQMRLGRAAIVHGDLSAAEAALCRAASWNANSAEIALDLALVLLLERDGADAVTWARRAVELDPKNSAAEDALGDALARVGSDAEARTAFLAAAGIDPSNEAGVRALIIRAMKQADHALRHGDLVTAERAFRRAAILEPKSSSAASGLSYTLIELGEVAPGVVWARRGVELAPRNSGARLALGDALARSGDKVAAASEWREAALLDPGNREAQRRLRAAGLPPT
jgi:Flp pilus assembly protein TadD